MTGLTIDGVYTEYMIAFEESLVSIPNEINANEAAPLMYAGGTSFSAIRNNKARPGDPVAISGIGGPGHLAVQYARKAGFQNVCDFSGYRQRRVGT